jgi:hypothetical protein
LRLLKQAYYQHGWYFIKKYLTKLKIYIILLAMPQFFPNTTKLWQFAVNAADQTDKLNCYLLPYIAGMLALNRFVVTGRIFATAQNLIEGSIVAATTSLALGACWGATKFCCDILDDINQQEFAYKTKKNQPKNS